MSHEVEQRASLVKISVDYCTGKLIMVMIVYTRLSQVKSISILVWGLLRGDPEPPLLVKKLLMVDDC